MQKVSSAEAVTPAALAVEGRPFFQRDRVTNAPFYCNKSTYRFLLLKFYSSHTYFKDIILLCCVLRYHILLSIPTCLLRK